MQLEEKFGTVSFLESVRPMRPVWLLRHSKRLESNCKEELKEIR